MKGRARKNQQNEQAVPPHNLDAEKSVLGSVLLLNEAIDEISIGPEDFYDQKNQWLFHTILDMWKRGDKAIDPVTLGTELSHRRRLEECGGADYILELLEFVPHAAHVRYYAETVASMARARRIIFHCKCAIEALYDEHTPEDIEQTAAILLRAVDNTAESDTSDFITLDEAVSEFEEHRANPAVVKSTGLRELDAMLNGGFRAGQSIVVAGRPGSGKSVLKCQCAYEFASNGEPALIVSLEMRAWEITERYSQWGRSFDRKAPIFFDQSSRAAHDIVRRIRNAHRRHQIKLAVVDYLQLVEPDDRREQRERQVADISRAMKLLAGELDIPIILGCQLNRQSEAQNRPPRLSDLRESGSIEQDADVVILLHEDEDQNGKLIIAKNRRGRKGEVPVVFEKHRSRFVDVSPHSEDWTGNL